MCIRDRTDADLLQGVGFSAWLVSDLKVKADGSYDFDSARPAVLTADDQTEMFTDEKGYARSIQMCIRDSINVPPFSEINL